MEVSTKAGTLCEAKNYEHCAVTMFVGASESACYGYEAHT